MPRTYTADQYDRLTRAETWPIVLVELNYGSPIEYLSCSGSVTYDGDSYTEGGAELRRVEGGRAAEIAIRLNTSRVNLVETSGWINGTCKIYYIPGIPGETPTYTTADSFTLVDGLIDAVAMEDDRILVRVINKYLKGQLSPALHISTICNHIPGAGSVTEWEGEKLGNTSVINLTLNNYIRSYGEAYGTKLYNDYLRLDPNRRPYYYTP